MSDFDNVSKIIYASPLRLPDSHYLAIKISALIARVREEERARLSEGIDVENEAEYIDYNTRTGGLRSEGTIYRIKALVSKVRAETEAAVTKRERDACADIADRQLADALAYNKNPDVWAMAETIRNLILTRFAYGIYLDVYESNDAGGKP